MTPQIIDKLGPVLDSIDHSMIMQSSFLESVYNMMVPQQQEIKKQTSLLERLIGLKEREMELTAEEREDAARLEDLRRLDQERDVPPPAPDEAGPRGTAAGKDEKGLFSSLFGGLFEGLGNLNLLSFLGIPFKIAIATAVGSFLDGLITRTLEDLEVDSDIANAIGDSISTAAIWGAIGSIFGRRFAVIAAIGGLLSNHIEKLFDQNGDGITEAFGMEFNSDIVAGMGAILGAVFAKRALLLLGPKGAIALALAGLAVAGLSVLGNWLRDKDSQVRQDTFDKLKEYDDMNPEDIAALPPEEQEAASRAAAAAMAEANRAQQLVISEAERAEAAAIGARAAEIAGAMPLNPDEGVNRLQIASRSQLALQGDTNAMNELIGYVQARSPNLSPEEVVEEIPELAYHMDPNITPDQMDTLESMAASILTPSSPSPQALTTTPTLAPLSAQPGAEPLNPDEGINSRQVEYRAQSALQGDIVAIHELMRYVQARQPDLSPEEIVEELPLFVKSFVPNITPGQMDTLESMAATSSRILLSDAAAPILTIPDVPEAPGLTMPNVLEAPALTMPNVLEAPALTMPNVPEAPGLTMPNVPEAPALTSSRFIDNYISSPDIMPLPAEPPILTQSQKEALFNERTRLINRGDEIFFDLPPANAVGDNYSEEYKRNEQRVKEIDRLLGFSGEGVGMSFQESNLVPNQESPQMQRTAALETRSIDMAVAGQPVFMRGGDVLNKGGNVIHGGNMTVINNLLRPEEVLRHIPT